MGFKEAAVLAPVSFFLGVLFICFNIDHRILWGSAGLTEDIVSDGIQFYGTFYNAPPAIKALLHAMICIGLAGALMKLLRWDESAMFFDGTCLVAYVFSICVYITVTIPSLRAIVAPRENEKNQSNATTLSILSAGNVIMIGCLMGVLCFQAGQEYAQRSEARERARIEKQQKTAEASAKKDE